MNRRLIRFFFSQAPSLLLVGCTTSTEVGTFNPNDPRGDLDAGAGATVANGIDGPVAQPDGSTSPLPIPPGAALLRFRHVAEDVGRLDFCLVSETKTVGPLFGSLGISTGVGRFANEGYLEVPAGSYEIRAVGAGLPCTQAPILTTKGAVSIAADTRSTLLTFGHNLLSNWERGPALVLLRDDATPDPLKRKIRFVHAAPEFPGGLDLEWLQGSATTYAVALEGAPYGGVARASRLGSVSADGYASLLLSSSGGTGYRFRVEGISALERPNTLRTLVNKIEIGAAMNFTVIVFGHRRSEQGLQTDFVICADADTRAAAGSNSVDGSRSERCTPGFEP